MNACAPVLFLVFNRPEQTRLVFEAIRAARPAHLYVAADGPRPGRPGETERCEQARQIAMAVDWPCRVEALLRERNLGCGRAVSEAISWFFAREQEGIILEDDCLPAPDFFRFSTEMLARYRHDARIGKIAGTNPLGQWRPDGDANFFFSSYGYSWGWASWRDRWQDFEYVAPASVIQWGGGHDANTGGREDRNKPGGLVVRLFHQATPANDNNFYYFFSTAVRGLAKDHPGNVAFHKDILEAFLEDKLFMESQQEIVSRNPERALILRTHDKAVAFARQAIHRLQEKEKDKQLQAAAQ